MNMAPRVIATMRTVVRMEAMIIFMRVGCGRPSAARRRIAQEGGNQNVEGLQLLSAASAIVQSLAQAAPNSAQARPVIGDDDGIAGIGGVVLDAGGLACNKPLEANLSFQAGDVLRSVISNAGNRIAVGDEVARPSRFERAGAPAKQTLACFLRFRRVLNKFDHLAFRNSPNLVQMKTALAFRFFRVHRRAEECVSDPGQRGDRGATHGQHQFPVSEQGLQATGSVVSYEGALRSCAERFAHALEQEKSLCYRWPHCCVFYLIHAAWV